MLYRDPKELMVSHLNWDDLTIEEQRVYLNAGYKLPLGTILRNNLDVEYPSTRKTGHSKWFSDQEDWNK